MKSFLKWCRRYVSPVFVCVAILFVYVVFFNDHSYSHLSELNGRIDDLRDQIKQNEDTMLHYRELNHLLTTSPEEMERIAREQYRMQRPNEEVFIVCD